ncbi:unnamed protein product [Sphagnum troendelagicum]|uniref:ribulose-bisphosphate carboxylase n=1 Tax=Sphagnum troendelagicum TaxID=128251 RepID=A0ABP0V4A6_9BRYO
MELRDMESLAHPASGSDLCLVICFAHLSGIVMLAVDDYIPEPKRNLDKPFLMPIEDVFSIQGPNLKTTVTGVEMFKKQLDQGRAVYECLRGGLDFTKDDENVNSQPFMCWRDRFVFVAEAIYKSQAEMGEIKGHYLNATAGTCEEMMKRAAFARELGAPIIMHDYLTGGFTANTTLAHYCRDNGLLLHIHCAMHAVIDRQKNHGMHFRVLAKALRLSGGDHIHASIVVGKLEGERQAGDNVGLLICGLKRDEVVCKPGTVKTHQKFEAEIYVLTKEEGGRHTAFFSNYRPQFYLRTADVTGKVELPEHIKMVMPGDNLTAQFELIIPYPIEAGQRFALREGGRTVGAGVISKLL